MRTKRRLVGPFAFGFNAFSKSSRIRRLRIGRRMSEAKSKGSGSTNGYTSKSRKLDPREEFPEAPLMKAVFTHLSYGLLILIGHVLDFLRKVGLKSDSYAKALRSEVTVHCDHAI